MTNKFEIQNISGQNKNGVVIDCVCFCVCNGVDFNVVERTEIPLHAPDGFAS